MQDKDVSAVLMISPWNKTNLILKWNENYVLMFFGFFLYFKIGTDFLSIHRSMTLT